MYVENCIMGYYSTVVWGNRKIQNPESEMWNRNPEPESGIGNRNPESGIRKPQITENKFFKFAKIILHSFCR